MAKKFALIGAAGFVAPRHMAAIKIVGGDLIASMDISDSVGVLDRYFKGCEHFTSLRALDEFCKDKDVDYVSVCSPNVLHLGHCLWGLSIGAEVICEKPLVLTTQAVDSLWPFRDKVWGMYQLRLHPEVAKLKGGKCSVRYHAPRGKWYKSSWKADVSQSGGIATNIGCHLFDLCCVAFGPVEDIRVGRSDWDYISGKTIHRDGEVDWKLSTQTYREPERVFSVDGLNLDFSSGMENLHTEMYRRILDGRGVRLGDVLESIRVTEEIRNDTRHSGNW